jgi:inositol phosphorylceramide mannosyltransferase catalytic subunit
LAIGSDGIENSLSCALQLKNKFYKNQSYKMAVIITPSDTVELDNILLPFVKQEIIDINNTVYPSRVLFPRIIHQIWFNPNPQIKDEWQATPGHWQRNHPGWVYILWNESLALEFITRFEPHFLDKYNSFPYLIQRCDAIRYCFLKRYGGLYVDLDIYPKEDISPYITDYSELYLIPSVDTEGTFNNSFMISQPGCSFWDLFISAIIDAEVEWSFTRLNTVLNTTGPTLMTYVVKQWGHCVVQLPTVLFAPLTALEIDSGMVTTERAIVILLPGRSWFNIYDQISHFFYRYKKELIFSGVCIVSFLLCYLGYNYQCKMKK